MKEKRNNLTFPLVHPPLSRESPERMSRNMLSKTISVHNGPRLIYVNWGEALLRSTCLHNRTSVNFVTGKYSHGALLGKTYDDFNPPSFVCKANILVSKELNRVMRGDICCSGILLKHCDNNYPALLWENGNLVESEYVIFNDRIFLIKRKSNIMVYQKPFYN